MTTKEEKFIDAISRAKDTLKGAKTKVHFAAMSDVAFAEKLLGEALEAFCHRPSADELYDDPSDEKQRMEELEG